MNSTSEGIGRTFDQVRAGLAARKSESVEQRKKRLKDMGRWIMDHRTAIHEALYQDMQKTAQEADISEVFPVLSELRHIRAHLRKWARPTRVSGGLVYWGTAATIRYEPKGACLIISPWNYPFLLAVGPLISALAAGNAVILKPSEYTPHTNGVIRQLVDDLLDQDLAAVIEGEAGVAQELLQRPFDHVFFTGSPAVGSRVMEAAAKNLTSVTLELGGKSPTIVDETAHLADAAEKIAWGKWLNAGQTCVAPDYLLVHASKAEELLAELEKQAQRLYGNETEYTGIINQRHFDRLAAAMDDAQAHQAQLRFGGEHDRMHCRMAPTVFTKVPPGARLMQEEIFGPILPVLTYTELDEAISFVNARPKPLSLYLYSRSKRHQKRIAAETSSGTLVINDNVLQFGHPGLPFGGINTSGMGRAHGRAGFQAFSNQKSVLRQRTGFTMAKTVYPPYSSLKKKTIDFMVKYF